MVKDSKIAEIERLSASVGGETVVAYALAPGQGALAPGAVSRIFGAPIGISDGDWPRHKRGDRLVHLVSLDFADAPELARHGARAVSIFIDDPDTNDCLYEPNPFNAKIVFLSEAQIASGVTADVDVKAPSPLVPTRLEVPAAAFTTDPLDLPEGSSLRALYDELFGLVGLAAKDPIWSAAGRNHEGRFVLQFSELLVPINLGDGGTMYVFDDVAFYQGF